MSHREMDRALQLHKLIAVLDVAIADEKAAEVTDIRAFAELRRKRAAFEAQLAAIETEVTCP